MFIWSLEKKAVMVSGRFVAVCAAGMVGSLFLGYCVYFDKKRRSDPNYKKKVLARRRAAKRHDNTIDLRDPKAKQEFITSELQKANIKLSEGDLESAIRHYVNIVMFSGDPQGALMALQQLVPRELYIIICKACSSLVQRAATKKEEDVD